MRSIPTALANNLLKHPEFIRDDEPLISLDVLNNSIDDTAALLEQSQKEQEAKDKENTELLDEIDAVRRMDDKDTLQAYAMKNFHQKLPKNQSVEWMKDKVLNLLDTMGVPE